MSEAEPQRDPRVFFSSERTLLAWLRTGLAIMALGFVVARFGLFLRLSTEQTSSIADSETAFMGRPWVSASLGILFVITGALAIFAATFQHRRFVASLSASDRPQKYTGKFAVGFSLLIGVLGLLLAGYLALSPR